MHGILKLTTRNHIIIPVIHGMHGSGSDNDFAGGHQLMV